MSFFKNKHVILAMFVAPVLAIIAYFATDHVVSEKPHQVQQGTTYNCRYQSGQCNLKNGDIEVSVRVERVSDSAVKLILQSNTPVQNALASLTEADANTQPATMYRSAADDDIWNAEFSPVDAETGTLRLALEIAGSVFYAETPTAFIDYETTFSRDNFSR